MRCNADRLIEALISSEMVGMHRQQAEQKEKLRQREKTCVVTVSRDFGSMGKLVAQMLADTLEVSCCDRYILQEVARRANVDEALVHALDEHVSRISGHWWQHFLQKDALSYEDYYHSLVKTVLSISVTGGVIIGRGANIILGAEKAFLVRIIGSLQVCAKRVASRDGIDLNEATELTRKVNSERSEYLRMLYHADINDPSHYDLVLNSDRYDCRQMVEIILDAMEKAGYKLPADARKSLSILAK
jgi:hypothetical protein